MNQRRNRRGERGAALILSVLVIFILTVLGLALLFTTTTEVQVAGAETTLNKTFYSADSGSQFGIYQVKTKPTNPVPTAAQGCSSDPTYFCFQLPERSTASADRTISVQVSPMKLVNLTHPITAECGLNINGTPCSTYEYSFTASATDLLPGSTSVNSTKTISVVTSVGPIPAPPI